MNVIIRRGQPEDLGKLQELFIETVRTVCRSDYNEQQVESWVSSVKNKERWLGIVTKQFLLVAEDQGKIVGFCSLEKDNDVDLLYVHKDHQGQGIATKLYSGIEQEAIKKGQTQLTADVSITARPFFEKIGFKIIEKRTVVSQGVELTNFKMVKELER